jgi:hypothetical protein
MAYFPGFNTVICESKHSIQASRIHHRHYGGGAIHHPSESFTKGTEYVAVSLVIDDTTLFADRLERQNPGLSLMVSIRQTA